jgi:hypothetical protein
LDGSLGGFAEQGLELGEDLLDGAEIGAVRGGRNRSFAPAARRAWRTALPLWLPRLSMMTTSPGFSVGIRTCSPLRTSFAPSLRCIKFGKLLLGVFDALGRYIDCMIEHLPLSKLQAFELLDQVRALPPVNG